MSSLGSIVWRRLIGFQRPVNDAYWQTVRYKYQQTKPSAYNLLLVNTPNQHPCTASSYKSELVTAATVKCFAQSISPVVNCMH